MLSHQLVKRQEVLFILQLTTFFRIFTAIPIEIVLGALTGSGAGLLFFAPLLMILFRKKYPARWFKWNLEFLRFNNRINIYLALMDDHYPSTTEQQSVHLDCPYPDMGMGLNRWLPLVKWFLAIPHYVILFFLGIAVCVAVIVAWFAILFTGHYPKGIFDFVEGVMRWSNRVIAYAFLLTTDQYPPVRLNP
jgi:hypothetical protein